MNAKGSLLIAEDNSKRRKELHMYLFEKGYNVFSAVNPENALVLLEQRKFDGIIADGDKIANADVQNSIKFELDSKEFNLDRLELMMSDAIESEENYIYDDCTIDVNNMSEMVNNDESILRELMETFIQDVEIKVFELERSILNEKKEDIIYYSHYIKNSVGNFLAKEAYDIAYGIESSTKNNMEIDAIGEFSKLKVYVERIEKKLTKLIKES